MKKATAIRLEHFYGIFLNPPYRCAQNLRAIFETTKGLVALMTQKTTNTFRASFTSPIRTAIMVVVYAPTFSSSWISGFANPTYFRLLFVPVKRETSFFAKFFNARHLYFFWLLSIKTLRVCNMFLSLFLKTKRQTLLAYWASAVFSICHKILFAIMTYNLMRLKLFRITLTTSIPMGVSTITASFVRAIISSASTLRETFLTARHGTVIPNLRNMCHFTSWA